MKVKKVSLLMVGLLAAMLLLVGGCGQKASTNESADNNKKEISDKSWSNVKDRGELIVGLCAQYAPFESVNEKTKQIEGFDIDLANALGKELGVKVKIVDAEWEALLGGVSKGDYDVLITCMSKKEAASGNINMSDVYYKLNEIIVVKKDNTSIKSVDDLKGKVVGVQTACGSEQAVDSLTGLKEVKRYNRNPEAFIDLVNNRIDAVVVGYAYAATQLKDKKDLKIINSPVGETSEVVMVNKKGADALTSQLNKALAAIRKNGEYDKAIDTWLKL